MIERKEVHNLIDLFVEMNFAHMHNAMVRTQFKLVAYQMGFSEQQVNDVVQLGEREYQLLVTNLEKKPFQTMMELI